jgi:outer membrane lipoprotein LolB
MRRAIAAVAIVLAACATAPSAPVSQAPLSSADSPFELGGRISARRGDAGVAGSFAWRHEPAHDAIELSSPLGQMIAKLEGDASMATVQLSDGRTETAPTWRALTERAFGVTIPVDGLAAWIRAEPRQGAPYQVDRDGAGRVSELRQDGWDIVYAYEGDSPAPFRVTASYPGADPVEVRVVIDRRQ